MDDYEFVYHATNLESVDSIIKKISPFKNKGATDLGHGFYCGINMETCINYALSKDGRLADKKYQNEYVYVGVVCFAIKKSIVDIEIRDDTQLKKLVALNRHMNSENISSENQDQFASYRSKTIKSTKSARVGQAQSWDGIQLVPDAKIKFSDKDLKELHMGLLGVCVIGRKMNAFKN
eukprot:NODE_408_length_7975_cov_0.539487.p6 type:complete len:178 gc:universal NODE_408_length_7975_cov_0.539487:5931-5398(-)